MGQLSWPSGQSEFQHTPRAETDPTQEGDCSSFREEDVVAAPAFAQAQ